MNQKELGMILNYSQSVVSRLLKKAGYVRVLARTKPEGGFEIVPDMAALVPELKALIEK